jgi:acyl-CoA reductase-like NAD-dependent aldehyde dehydrogenase
MLELGGKSALVVFDDVDIEVGASVLNFSKGCVDFAIFSLVWEGGLHTTL